MTNNDRFQPGDRVRVKSSTLHPVDLGLAPSTTYTVAHVDDFGRVSPQGDSRYFHPSHFELVMRAVADETYCLLDGEGDWWILDEAPDAVPVWRMVDRPDVLHDVEDGIEQIERDYGIKALPTAPAETYCLKDEDGDWWTYDVPSDTWTCVDRTFLYPRTGLDAGADDIVSIHGIDTDTEDDGGEYETEMALAYEEPGNSTGPSLRFEAAPFVPGDRVEYIGGGEVETRSLIGKVGTVDTIGDEPDDINVEWDDSAVERHGVLAENLRKVTDPAPLQPGDWVKVLARVEHVYESNGSVKAQTFQSDGTGNGPSIYAVASAITRTDEVPEWARTPRDRIAALIADMGHADQSSERIADEILAQWDVTERHTEGTN